MIINMTPEQRERRRREFERARRNAAIKGAVFAVVGVAVVLGTLFAVVYLATLAVRLAWGS